MNIFDKKINKLLRNRVFMFLLIIIAFVVIFGISFLFIYNNNVNSDICIYFNDKDFYKLIVDSYNKENNDNKKYEDCLTLNELSSIKVVGDDSSSIVSNIEGIDRLSNLEELYINIKDIDKIDLSNNIKLKNISIKNDILYSSTKFSINLSKLNNLRKLHLTNVNDLDLSNNLLLEDLSIINDENTNYELIKLDTSMLNNLKKIYVKNVNNLDLSKNINLEEAGFDLNYEMDLSKNINLKKLMFTYSFSMTETKYYNFDLSKNINLEELMLTAINIGKLDLSKNINLKKLSFELISISDMVILNSNNSITNLSIWDSNIDKINIKDMTKLERLSLTRINKLTRLDLSNYPNLKKLFISKLGITSLDLSKNNKLEDISVNAYLNSINMGDKPNLKKLYLGSTKLDNLDLSKAPLLEELILENEKSLRDIDLSNNINLKYKDIK